VCGTINAMFRGSHSKRNEVDHDVMVMTMNDNVVKLPQSPHVQFPVNYPSLLLWESDPCEQN